MTRPRLQIAPLTPTIGAEIEGLDLAQAMDPATGDAVYAALLEHLVVFFRDQELSPRDHLDFARMFGELDRPHPSYPHVAGFEQIVMLAYDASNPPDTDSWHTDLTYRDEPPFASVLVARDVPASGGDTLWTNMYAAYEALPEGVKRHIEGLRAVHEMGSFRNDFTRDEVTGAALVDAMQRFGAAIHDIVKTHPMTGRRFLYVNEGFTSHVVGMRSRDSRRLLDYLLDHIDQPEFQVRFRWQPGSVAMWDNRCTQHYAVADYLPAHRCMHRVTVVRDRRATAAVSPAA